MSIPCPTCSQRLKCINSRGQHFNKLNYTTRRYHCDKCHTRFSSVELMLKDTPDTGLPDGGNLFTALKQQIISSLNMHELFAEVARRWEKRK